MPRLPRARPSGRRTRDAGARGAALPRARCCAGKPSSSATCTSTGTRASRPWGALSARAPGRCGSRGSASASRCSPIRACRSSTRSPGWRWRCPGAPRTPASCSCTCSSPASAPGGWPPGSGRGSSARGPRHSRSSCPGRSSRRSTCGTTSPARRGCRGCCWRSTRPCGDRRVGATLGLAAALALQVLAGSADLCAMTLVLALALALARLWRARRSPAQPGARARLVRCGARAGGGAHVRALVARGRGRPALVPSSPARGRSHRLVAPAARPRARSWRRSTPRVSRSSRRCGRGSTTARPIRCCSRSTWACRCSGCRALALLNRRRARAGARPRRGRDPRAGVRAWARTDRSTARSSRSCRCCAILRYPSKVAARRRARHRPARRSRRESAGTGRARPARASPLVLLLGSEAIVLVSSRLAAEPGWSPFVGVMFAVVLTLHGARVKAGLATALLVHDRRRGPRRGAPRPERDGRRVAPCRTAAGGRGATRRRRRGGFTSGTTTRCPGARSATSAAAIPTGRPRARRGSIRGCSPSRPSARCWSPPTASFFGLETSYDLDNRGLYPRDQNDLCLLPARAWKARRSTRGCCAWGRSPRVDRAPRARARGAAARARAAEPRRRPGARLRRARPAAARLPGGADPNRRRRGGLPRAARPRLRPERRGAARVRPAARRRDASRRLGPLARAPRGPAAARDDECPARAAGARRRITIPAGARASTARPLPCCGPTSPSAPCSSRRAATSSSSCIVRAPCFSVSPSRAAP